MIGALQIAIGGLVQGCVFAVIALGFSLVYRVTGVVNLAQGAFAVVAALMMYSLQVSLGLPLPVAFIGAVAGTALVGAAIGAASFVPGLARLPAGSMLVMTAGLLTLIDGVILIGWGSQPYALPAFTGEAPLVVAGLRLPTQGLWVGAITAVIVAALWFLLARTRIGLALKACAENRLAARLMGIDAGRMALLAFVLAAVIAGVGGIAVAPITSLQFDSGQFFTNFGFIGATLGGLGSFAGSVFGGLLVGLAEQGAAFYVSSLFANALALAILLATLLWRPNGLLVAGAARRQDVRDERRVDRGIVRLRGRRKLVCGIAGVALATALPAVLDDGVLLDSLVIAGILYIAVLGLDVAMGFAGQVNLGQSGFMAIGGYAAAILATTYGVPPLLGIAAGMILALVAALVLSLVTLRLRGHYLALATLAFGLLVDALAIGMDGLTGGPSGLTGIPSFAIGGIEFGSTRAMYYLVGAVILALLLILGNGMRAGFGRALQAVRADETAAAALGVNVIGHKLAAFCIGAMLAALAGGLYAFQFHFLSPDMVGTPRSFEMVAMLVIGGEGSLVGPLFGAILLTLLPALFQPLALYKTLAEGALMVGCFLWLRHGLFGALAAALSPRRAR